MKRVSAKLFFTVLGRGLWQAVEWFLGLFGYKREGVLAKWAWRVFATSAAIVMALFAILCILALVDFVTDNRISHAFDRWQDRHEHEYTYHMGKVSVKLERSGKHSVRNLNTGQTFLEDVTWVVGPSDQGSSLACFCKEGKRGYFDIHTGSVVIEPKYDHAWMFADGLASVDDNGYIKFIDQSGNVVIDKGMKYEDGDGYMFHGGYCMVHPNDDYEHYGLMDTTGQIVLPMEYETIHPYNNDTLWFIVKGDKKAVLNKELNVIVPFSEHTIEINEYTIDVTRPNHTIRKYNLQGAIISDFCINDIRVLEYEGSNQPSGRARLLAYEAADDFEGLMTNDGQIVTMPLYIDIDAIGPDLYLCTMPQGYNIIVNGKGETIKMTLK